MRLTALVCCLLLLLSAGGCSRFAGEWVEDAVILRDGTVRPVEGDQRLALKFNPPSTVRFGAYVAPAGVVDRETVRVETYFTMKKGRVAQAGGLLLRHEGDHLVGVVTGEVSRRFVRADKPSVFPQMSVLPSLLAKKADGDAPAAAAPALAAAAAADANPPEALDVAPGGAE